MPTDLSRNVRNVCFPLQYSKVGSDKLIGIQY